MGNMVRRCKTILGKTDFTLLYDKGYHTGTEFGYANKQGVEVMVAIPEVASQNSWPATVPNCGPRIQKRTTSTQKR